MTQAHLTDMDIYTPMPLSTPHRYCSQPLPGAHRDEKTTIGGYVSSVTRRVKKSHSYDPDHGHDESDALYQLAWNEFQDVKGTLQQR
ncbi:hypothetical protein TNCV_1022741 [Trichonephila clavipes]|nr:hypothetical protein TNCV_1022741 [Trichonephila clavipes]